MLAVRAQCYDRRRAQSTARPIVNRHMLRAVRLLLYAGAFLLGALLVIALGDVLYSGHLRDLRPWQTEKLDGEFRAADLGTVKTLADYRAREERLFAQVDALRSRDYDPALDGLPSRYSPQGSPLAARLDRDWNRSFELPAQPQRAVALLLHGLSDSPYSLRSIGLALQAHGVTAYGVRMPGHGTLPGELDRADWPDWAAAVDLALADIRARHPGVPLYVVGYSTGAALSVQAAVAMIEQGRTQDLPRRIFLLSPAFGVSPFARLANVQRIITSWGVGQKSRWTEIELEIDPYKYQSFTKNAGAQVALLVAGLDDALRRLREQGRGAALPPILSFQSVVDRTVSTPDTIDRLYGVIDNPRSELVLFDLNRDAEIEPFLTFSPKAIIEAFKRLPARNWQLTVITNEAAGTPRVAEQRHAPGSTTPVVTPLGLEWPRQVFSLSHVALPFPPDDPVYGDRAMGPKGPLPTLGTLSLRGERDVLSIPASEQLRLRSNPFHGYVLERILGAIDADLAK
jgi:alpha-beta hydrolase superfamily lysophospholipase